MVVQTATDKSADAIGLTLSRKFIFSSAEAKFS
jgi:hypothetical protein